MLDRFDKRNQRRAEELNRQEKPLMTRGAEVFLTVYFLAPIVGLILAASWYFFIG